MRKSRYYHYFVEGEDEGVLEPNSIWRFFRH